MVAGGLGGRVEMASWSPDPLDGAGRSGPLIRTAVRRARVGEGLADA